MNPNSPLKVTKKDIVATIKGIEVLKAPHLKPSILRQIRNGQYERPEMEFGLANLRPGDRVMEMGAGAGIVGAVFAKHIDHLTIRSFEANPNLIEHIRKLYEHNNIAHIASVLHHVVVTGDNPDPLVDFLVHPDFLSDATQDNAARVVPVPTRDYATITREYPHNVLIMNIEERERDFLAHADLSDVELVMLELHPKVYGGAGRAQVFQYLADKGFVLDKYTSRDQVASFKKPSRMKLAPDFRFIGAGKPSQETYELNPSAPQVQDIIIVEKAVLAQKPNSEGFRIKAAVFDDNRNIVPEAVCWVSHRTTATIERSPPRRKRIKPLPGTWMFGGRFFPHFGHFLCETLARLWALDHLDEPIEGVLFFTTKTEYTELAQQFFGQLSEILDVSIDYKICDAFYQVDRLIVPPQGCGIGRLVVSSPEMRDYVSRHLKRDFKPTPHKKIYISRTGDFNKVGRSVAGESRLETLLKAEGYLIFHPEEHSWKEQLRHYLSAEHILGLDGSAFHLVNFTGRDDLNMGIIQRRPGSEAAQMVQQGQLYGIEKSTVFSHLGRYWARAGDRRAGLAIICELKFASLCEDLKACGFINQSAQWDDTTEAELEQMLLAIANDAGTDLRLVNSVHDSLENVPARENPNSVRIFM